VPETIADLLEEAATLPITSPSRNRLEDQVLEETGITTMNQVATLVEAVARRAALENGAHGDEDSAEALFGSAQTISSALRKLHDLIQTLA
jgi:hypothetical protein